MHWKKENNQLVRFFEFGTQTELAEFVMKLARLSDRLDHHADLEVFKCSQLKVKIGTHETNSITEKDEKWIQEVDQLLNSAF